MNPSSSDHLPERLLCSMDEAASLLGVKRTFLFGLIAKGELPSYKIGRLRKVLRADLDRFVEGMRVAADARSQHDSD